MTKVNCLIILLGLFSKLSPTECARILAIIPTTAYSHQTFFRPLWRELAHRGHEVVLLTTIPMHENITNLREIDMTPSYQPFNVIEMTKENPDNSMVFMDKMIDLYFNFTYKQFALPEVQQLIANESEHFDLAIIEYLFPTMMAFKFRFNCPFIGVASMYLFNFQIESSGNPTHSVLYPSIFFPHQANLTFWQRLTSVLLYGIGKMFVLRQRNAEVDAMVEKNFGPGYPNVDELYESVDMLLINNNPIFYASRPVGRHTISLVGGMHMQPQQPLPQELQTFLDEATQGAIYFSLGTTVRSKQLSQKTLDILMQAFALVPYKVLWKFENDELPNKPDNVKIWKWVPQQDVLRHKNLKVFITQAGLQSLEEAIYSHVPMITLPCHSEQISNGLRIQEKGLGLTLYYNQLTVEQLTNAINEVIGNATYKDNVRKWATILQDDPMKPLDKAVWWTEYVLRHKGAKHLKGPKIPLYQYYYLDIWGFVLCVVACLAIIVKLCLGYAYCQISKCGLRKHKQKGA